MGTHSRTGMREAVAAPVAATPRLVQWMATLRCGLSCPHCLAVTGGPMADMPVDAALSLVDQVADMGTDEFLLTGGEPMARADLPTIIDRLGRRGVSYSINTAVFPPAGTLAAMRKNPPAFVAVSVDGPADVHDAFRGRIGALDEAIEAIALYKDLGATVAAGTTLTTVNFGRLNETLHLVSHSGADSWGLHLAVPEGRAADRPDLMLSNRQLKQLVRFVAAKRSYFPVSMADEIGYCGDWEPLVRDRPLVCGAGRTHCVVLPDGNVVPCTTLDVSTSAGNLHERPLAEIWRDGFADLRAWTPDRRCRRCAYVSACRGGCWLQRRNGAPCAKPAWHVPAALKTAAGVIVCLGALQTAPAAEPGPTTMDSCGQPGRVPAGEIDRGSTTARRQERSPDSRATSPSAILARYILEAQCPPYDLPENVGRRAAIPQPLDWNSPPKEVAGDPAWRLLTEWQAGKLDTLAKRTEAVRRACRSELPSIATVSLMWRVLCEPLLDDEGPAKRTAADRDRICRTLALIDRTATAWRKQIVEKQLDPYVSADRNLLGDRMTSKAGPPWTRPHERLASDTDTERWPRPTYRKDDPPHNQTVAEYIERHPVAEHMQLTVRLAENGDASFAGEEERPLKADQDAAWGVFDVLTAGGKDTKLLLVVPKTAHPRDARAAAQIASLPVTVPAGTEITYLDLLRLACEQNRIGQDHPESPAVYTILEVGRLGPRGSAGLHFGNWPGPSIVAMPAVRKPSADDRKADTEGKVATEGTPEAARAWFLADFWMF